MAEKAQNRTIYIAGIAVLVVLVVVALVWRGSGSGSADAGARDGGAPDGDAAAAVDGGATSDGAATNVTPPPADVGPVVPPSDPSGCRAYCQGLADRGELRRGTTVEQCQQTLCTGADGGVVGEDDSPAEEIPTVSPPSTAELPSECEAQCQALADRGELRAGMTVQGCVEAMCDAEEE